MATKRSWHLSVGAVRYDQAGEEADSSTQRKAARSLLEQACRWMPMLRYLDPRSGTATGPASRRVESSRRFNSSQEGGFGCPQQV